MPALRDAPVVLVEEPGRAPLHVILVEPLEVGRDGAGLLVGDPQVSRHHLELRPEGRRVWVRDLGATHGTTLDGVRLNEPVLLQPGSVVRLGNTTIALAGIRDAGSTWSSGTGRPRSSIERVAAEVVASGPAVRNAVRADRTVTIAFSDIESSTELATSLGDAHWFEVLSVHNDIIRRAVRRHDGTEIKAQGDGFMLAFESARRGVHCMIDVQRELSTHVPTPPEPTVRVRVGLHTGEAIVDENGDMFGRHVNLAARIADTARGGEILVSSLVREIVEARGDLSFGEPRAAQLKGLSGTYLLHPVRWENSEEEGSESDRELSRR